MGPQQRLVLMIAFAVEVRFEPQRSDARRNTPASRPNPKEVAPILSRHFSPGDKITRHQSPAQQFPPKKLPFLQQWVS
jgi:hypothetical protein